MSDKYFTVPKLARQLGVTPASVREWILRGLIEEPPMLPVTGERAYTAEASARIERWYMGRVANGRTRGPGAAARRERAQAWFAAEEEKERALGQELDRRFPLVPLAADASSEASHDDC